MTQRVKDTLFAEPLSDLVDFQFDEKVVAVFPDMIQRSVPGYATMLSMIGMIAARYLPAGSRCYDLGCSLGAVSFSIAQRVEEEAVELIAVDQSAAMLDKARSLAQSGKCKQPIHWQCENILQMPLLPAAVVVMHLTLQFIPPDERAGLLQRIYRCMEPGGILLVTEKLAFTDPLQSTFMQDLHHDFKRANGYSDLEISQKRQALEKVMIPESLAVHQERFKAAGFRQSFCWFQAMNFASMIAFK